MALTANLISKTYKIIEMKNIKSQFTILFILSFVFVSCKKGFFYEGVNIDPNKVTREQLDKSPGVLLNGAEETLGFTVGGDISRFSSTMLQSVRGASRQFVAFDNYLYTAQNFDNAWLNMYAGVLNNLVVAQKISDKNGYNHYSGITRAMIAYTLGVMTDMWGDVPATEAVKGFEGVTQPKYDTQSKIYELLQSTLDSAITYLDKVPGSVKPGADDFLYNGNAGRWKKFAYSLKARYYLHLSNLDNNWASKALAAIDKGFAGNADNARVPFFNSETASNPWYQYFRDRADIYVGDDEDLPSNVVVMLQELEDPRLEKFAEDEAVGPYLASINSDVTLMGYSELLFIKAEAMSAINNEAYIQAFDDAVTASFEHTGVNIPEGYLADNSPIAASHQQRLAKIIKQKYISLFTSPEAFNDYRRTGYPVITPVTGSNMPARFLYPQNELDNNKANVPKSITLFSKMIWAKQ